MTDATDKPLTAKLFDFDDARRLLGKRQAAPVADAGSVVGVAEDPCPSCGGVTLVLVDEVWTCQGCRYSGHGFGPVAVQARVGDVVPLRIPLPTGTERPKRRMATKKPADKPADSH